MADGFSVNTGALSGVAPRLSDEATRLIVALATLRSRLDACGTPWGDDQAGQVFGAHYLPHRPKIENALCDVARGLARVNEALLAMADDDAADHIATIANA